ncbi:MAG TPA: metalloregulator ArsR/SmtB family transcription factor [Acidimicrobiales bacterium]|nr:metalloregulator ArsR/SmtB family transcription factor [Acidimicrobiales bacterium]
MDAVFVALADATRRRVLELLADEGGATATQLAGSFPVTRQAIAKHLQVLADAGLATSERRGRETRWTLRADALTPAMTWMASLGEEADAFEDRLAALQRHLAERAGERRIGIVPRPAPAVPGGPLRVAASGRPARPQPPSRSPFGLR